MVWGRLKAGKFLAGTAVLVSATVGVGIFGLPFVFSKAGFLIGLVYMLAIAGLTLLINLMYGEVVLRTEEKHQLVGYTRRYLGVGFQRLVFFSAVFTGYAALLAYIIIAGDFLNSILSGFFYFSIQTYSILFFCALALLVLKGLKAVSWVDLFVGGLLIAVVVLIVIFGWPHLNFENYGYVTKEYWFLPYGVLLFAFAGLLGVPIQRELFQGRERLLKPSIIWAVSFIAVLYFVFTSIVLGISGDITTPDAISGLYEFLGNNIIVLGSIFGVLAVSTSFLMHASGLIEIFDFDFGIRRTNAWLLVVFPPLFLFIAGIRTFISIISLAGAVALGLEGIAVVMIYYRSKSLGNRVPEYSLNIPRPALLGILVLFAAGIIYALIF